MSNCPRVGIVEQTLLPLKMQMTSFRIGRGCSGLAFLFVLMCLCASVHAQNGCNFFTDNYNPCDFLTAKTMAVIENPQLDLITVSSHRGLHALVDGTNPHVPENSLQAIGLAAQAGLEMIELDIKLSSDNQPVMSHDQTWGRETNYGASMNTGDTFNPFILPGNTENDALNPPVSSISLAGIQATVNGTSGGTPIVQLRDTISLKWAPDSEDVSSLQNVLDYLTMHQIAMVLALDLRDAPTATAAWKVISSTTDYLGNSYAQSTLFKIPGKAFLNPANPGNFADTITGPCLDNSGCGTTPGNKVVVWTCTANNPNQNWQFRDLSSGQFTLWNQAGQLPLDDTGGSLTPGTQLQIWIDNSLTSQRWSLH